jgi:transposase
MPKTRPPYPDEFRREAVELVGSGRSIRDVAEGLGVSQQTLRNWVKQVAVDRRERDDGLTSAECEELRRLRRENDVDSVGAVDPVRGLAPGDERRGHQPVVDHECQVLRTLKRVARLALVGAALCELAGERSERLLP